MKRKSILPVSVLLVLFAASCATPTKQGAASQDPKVEAEIQYQSGIQAMSKGNWELAYFSLAKAVRLNPDDPKIHYALGTTQMGRGQLEEARKELSQTIKLDAKFADAYNNLGVVAMRQERWDEAIALFQKALEQLDYQTPESALTNIGWAYRRKNDLPKAVEYLNRAISINPEGVVTRRNLAEVYIAAGRLEKAREILLKLLDAEPGYAPGHLQLGIVFYKNKENAKAKEEFSTVIKLVPGSEDAATARSYLDIID